jgi:hypothetical protein
MMTVNPDPNDFKSISTEDRERLETMGEPYVRRVMSMAGGLPPPLNISAIRWLAEIDAKQRERTEAFQTEQTRVGRSTLRAAWIAAYVAAAGILVTVGVASVQYHMTQTEVAHNRMIKEGIGQYVGEGLAIMNRFGTNEMPMPITDEAGWVTRTENFLRTNLGDSYANRFNDVSGLGSVTGNGTDPQHNTYYNSIYLKITRLEEFSRERP